MLALPVPERVPRGIEVWMLELNLTADVASADLEILDSRERARAALYRRHADRVRGIATRAALRRLLGKRMGCAPAALAFATGAHGKPRVAGRADVVFNVAHSGSYALIAVSGNEDVQELGVDIERCDPALDLAALVPSVLAPAELAAIAAHETLPYHSATALFYERWVAKEAVLKAAGLGIAEHLRDVAIFPQPDGALRIEHTLPAGPALRAHRLCAPDSYAAALAWQLRN